ncbi:hypothetical protein ACFCV8_33110 [Streptomyces sp. NPDC056347]|uniref:hypothetical protein n=1 Tax=unclassified Streptomyces TaxID=2593676 RepID=UPI0035DC397F
MHETWIEEAVEDAERVRGELGAALEEAGVKLPSLAVDASSWAGVAMPVLIDLGRCNVGTARALAAALRARGAGCGQEAVR